jgi:hypothetical protein
MNDAPAVTSTNTPGTVAHAEQNSGRAAAAGCLECRRRDAKIAELAAKLNACHAREERRRQYDQLPNQTLSAKARLLASYFDDQAARWRAEGRTGPQTVNCQEAGAAIGFSESAARSGLDELEIVGYLRISRATPIEVPTTNGRTIRIEPIQVEVLGREPLELSREPRGHGGRHCKHCGQDAGTVTETEETAQVIRRRTRTTRTYCKGCRHHLGTTTDHYDEPLSPPTPIVRSGVNEPKFTGTQFDTASGDSATAAAAARAADQNEPHGDGDAAARAEENLTGPQLGNVNQGGSPGDDRARDDDETAPAPWPEQNGANNPDLTGTQIGYPSQDAVAELLAQVAGDGRTYIRLQPDGDDKYRTYAGAVTPDLALRHVAGEILIGARLWHAGGMTRALVWEGETPEEFAQLRHGAAPKLADSGARVILEGSPSVHHPGSGKLWLIFHSLVDAAAALATALHRAPELASCGEHWPTGGQAVSLPAGFYARDGVACWRDIWEPGGIHRTGPKAFAFLEGRLTSASWVTIDAPAPTVEASAPDRPNGARSNGKWIPPTRPLGKGERDEELTRYAMAMAGKCGMSEEEIFEELRRIRDALCEDLPSDPITDGALRSKARSAIRKYGPRAPLV